MTAIIKGDFTQQRKKNRQTGPKEKPAPIFQLKISLAFSDPLIWRRIQVSGDTNLGRLHDILQLCMGWSDLHAHRFLVGKVFYAPSNGDNILEKTGERDESEFRLAALETDMKWVFTYIYDFGDGWEHEIELEETLPAGKGGSHPVVLTGERACPPENVGGIPGYEEFLSIINNRHHAQHKRIAEWHGADHFDPDHFEMARINRALKRMK
jgi:hypothetical protein